VAAVATAETPVPTLGRRQSSYEDDLGCRTQSTGDMVQHMDFSSSALSPTSLQVQGSGPLGIVIPGDGSYRSLSNDENLPVPPLSAFPPPVKASPADSGSQQEGYQQQQQYREEAGGESVGLLRRELSQAGAGAGAGAGAVSDSPWPGIWRLVGEVDSLEPDKLLLSSLRDLMTMVKGE
jgi:hypothetical protein